MKKLNRMNQVLFNFETDQPRLFKSDVLIEPKKNKKYPIQESFTVEQVHKNLLFVPTDETVYEQELDQDIALTKLLAEEDSTPIVEKKKTTKEMLDDQVQDFDSAAIDLNLMYPKINQNDNIQVSDDNSNTQNKIINQVEINKDELTDDTVNFPIIKVIGIGGAGNNIVEYVTNSKSNLAIHEAVNFYQLNTDSQHLKSLKYCKNRFLIESDLTKGMGSGGNPECGKKATEDYGQKIRDILKGTDVCIIVAGMGKGTGTGGAPVIAKIAKELGILTLGFVTLPMHNEGSKTADKALSGLRELNNYVDAVSSISNDNALSIQNTQMSAFGMFKSCNEQIGLAIKMITDIILVPAFLNIDLADVRNFFARQNHIKSFLPFQVNFNNQDISKISDLITKEIKKSIYDQDLKNASNAMILFRVDDQTPNLLVEKGISELKRLVKNEDLNIMYGVRQINELENSVGFDVIALQDSAITVGTPRVLTSRIDYPISRYQVAQIDEPTERKHTVGDRSRFLKNKNTKLNTGTTLVSYSIMEDQIEDLLETKKPEIDTDKMSKIVSASLKTFFQATTKKDYQKTSTGFRDSKLFEN